MEWNAVSRGNFFKEFVVNKEQKVLPGKALTQGQVKDVLKKETAVGFVFLWQ